MSAARSNCCCATFHALISAAACSVVMERKNLGDGTVDAVLARRVVFRTTPRVRDAPPAWHAEGREAMPLGIEYRRNAGSTMARSSPCRNLTVTRAFPTGPLARSRPALSASAAPRRRRSRGRGGARRTARRSSAGRRDGSSFESVMNFARNSSMSALVVCRIEARSSGACGEQLERPLARLGPRPDALRVLHDAVLDGDDRLDVEHRADRGAGAADPAAALEVLERVEGEEDPQVRPCDARGRGRSPRPRRPRRRARTRSARASPGPSTPSASR